MKIKFLGTAPGMPELNKKHSCLYLKSEKLNFFADCGEGASQAFLEEGIDIEDLDFIFITHNHPDHISGIFMLIQLFFMKQRKKKLQIFIPESIDKFEEMFNFMYLFLGRLSFKVELLPCRAVSEYHYQLNAIRTDHLLGYKDYVAEKRLINPLCSYGLNVAHHSKVLTYTSDIVSISAIKEFIQNTDVCIIDAIHPQPAEYLELENIIRDKIYLTHGITQELKYLITNKAKFVVVQEKDVIEL
jgi:ribonuclease BN (tRNA processing enzyme)